jgi:hypothetical protein
MWRKVERSDLSFAEGSPRRGRRFILKERVTGRKLSVTLASSHFESRLLSPYRQVSSVIGGGTASI